MAQGTKRRRSRSPNAQRSKRRVATGTFDPPAIDFASLFRGPLDDGELSRVLRFVPSFSDWIFANWTAPNTVKVEVAERAETGHRGGRLAPRWLHDLYMGMLADRREDVGDLFTRCGDLPERLYLENSTVSPSTGHELLAIESQCPQSTAESQLISCICRHCKYHFLFHFQQESDINCASNTEIRKGMAGLCHLVLAESHVHTPTDGDIFNPVTSTGTWRCSASSTCSVQVSVSVSKPRMKVEHIKLILDEDRIRKQLQQAIREDPERFRSSKDDDDLARSTLPILNAYLRDCTSNAKDQPPRRIAVRNKLFYVHFGESCSHIFQYLGLQRRTVDDETYWFLPELEHYENEKTPINTQRAFMEDARSEIQALIEERGARDGEERGAREGKVQPWSPARFRLLQALNCPPLHDWNNFRFDANNVHLRALGTLPGPSDEVLKYAYQSQVDADPANLRYYCEALKAFASTEDLLLFVGCQESLLDDQPKTFEPTFNPRPSSNDPLAQAYAHFNLDPDCSEDDDFIIRKYNVFAQQSPAQKAQHRNQLYKIGSLRQSKKIMTAAASDFSLEEACDYLQLDREIKQGSEPSVELLETYVALAVESGAPRYTCAAALLALSEHFKSAALRSYAASVRREAFREAVALFDDLPADENINVAADTAEPVDLNLPPGLGNLRNTCYLNSILQYCYTVTPIRELVLNFDPNAPGPSLDLANKNPEVYLGREFVLELQKLFRSLRSASTKYVKPQQRLANAAWLSAHRTNAAEASEKTTSQTSAPPLPARPAPLPSVQAATAEATVTVAPIDLPTDDSPPASLDSSQTLINNPLESSYDDLMESDDQPAVVNPEKETAAEAHPEAEEQVKELIRRLDQTEVVGTDQMDVEEVMGRIFNHFRTVCNPLSIIHPNNPDYLRDIITETFFITFATMRKQMASNEYSRSESHERWVTASPALDGPVHLHDALTSFFDREIIGDNMLSYTVIARPPRIFHICIQRSTVGGGKNTNAIEIADVLYLDRYMEADENTPAYRARHRRWDIKSELERLATIKAGKEKGKESTAAGDSAPKAGSTPPSDDSVNRLIGGYDFPELEDEQLSSAEDYVIIGDSESTVLETAPLSQHDPSIAGNSTNPKKRKANAELDVDISPYEDDDLDGREATLRAELAGLFEGMEREKYVLHAIICHMGQRATSGHYWVWIYDFAARVWRKYNDTTVTERAESETATVLAELSAAGEPYYIAYVRDEHKENLVSVPPRVIEEVEVELDGEKMDVDGAM